VQNHTAQNYEYTLGKSKSPVTVSQSRASRWNIDEMGSQQCSRCCNFVFPTWRDLCTGLDDTAIFSKWSITHIWYTDAYAP